MVSHGRCLNGKDIILVIELSKPQEFCILCERPQSIVKSTALCAIVVQYIHLYQGNINCGASSQTDFLTF